MVNSNVPVCAVKIGSFVATYCGGRELLGRCDVGALTLVKRGSTARGAFSRASEVGSDVCLVHCDSS